MQSHTNVFHLIPISILGHLFYSTWYICVYSVFILCYALHWKKYLGISHIKFACDKKNKLKYEYSKTNFNQNQNIVKRNKRTFLVLKDNFFSVYCIE